MIYYSITIKSIYPYNNTYKEADQMIINITLTEEQKQQAARELDLNSLLRIVLAKTMVNENTMDIVSKIHEYLKNEDRKEIEQEQQESITPAEPIEQNTMQSIREYIIQYELTYWQDRLDKLTEISAPKIMLQGILEEIDNLKFSILTLKTGKKLSESPAINPSIKKVDGDYVLIEFDNNKAIHGKIEFCRKSGNKYVRYR